LVGSRNYTDKRKIKDVLFQIKEQHENVEIVSGGQKLGADGIVKKYALEFDMDYVEFPPSHYQHNMHCKLPAKSFNKPYYISNYFKRNKQIAEYCDIIIGFMPKNQDSRGTLHTLGEAQKQKKLVKIIN
tara:strand:+ start:408 stop:794 length:387 start_codon:yes stop_codon:yes gene_type:complete